MGIKPIKRVNVGKIVFDQMQEQIIKGEWKPGEKLPSENELAELFGVSRITIRQALQQLSALDLVETRVGEGSFVRTADASKSLNALMPLACLDNNSNLQMFEFREIIDTAAVGLATKRGNAQDFQDLDKILANMKKTYESEEYERFAKLDMEFHYKISEMTGNAFLIQTNAILKRVLSISMDEVIQKMGCEPALYYHEEILQAMKQKDREKAVSCMREHIRKNMNYFK